MDGSDVFSDDAAYWDSSLLREELFSDDNLGTFWNSDAGHPAEHLPPPRPSLPSTYSSSQPTLVQQQQQRLHNREISNSPTFHFQGSAPLERKHSHFELPNFPLATDPTGAPSNSSGRPPPPSSTLRPPRNPAPPPATRTITSPRRASPPSLDILSPPSDLSEFISELSDSPWLRSEEEDSNGYVDLTQESSPPTMPTARRTQTPAHHRPPLRRNALRGSLSEHLSEEHSNPAKRRKTGTEASQSSERSHKIEEVDLRSVNDDRGLSKVLEQQRMATIRAQQEQASKPVKLSTLQCIICMENMKDLTATHCGHLFCHTCLMEALIAGENQGSDPGKGTPKCPVCRKKVIRPAGASNRKSRDDIIPLAMKVKSRVRPAKGKGKGRALSEDWV